MTYANIKKQQLQNSNKTEPYLLKTAGTINLKPILKSKRAQNANTQPLCILTNKQALGAIATCTANKTILATTGHLNH